MQISFEISDSALQINNNKLICLLFCISHLGSGPVTREEIADIIRPDAFSPFVIVTGSGQSLFRQSSRLR